MSHKQDLMKGTMFQQITLHYTLKLPSKKSLSKKIMPKLEALALSFYSHVFEKIIQTDYKNTMLQNYFSTTQPVREAYTNFFYSLSTKSQKNLDFIACLICLLSQIIISGQKLQSDKKIQQFIDSLNKNQQKLRDYMYVLYTYETLACRVNNQSAKFIFDKYIVCQNNANETNIGTKLKLNIQLKKIKENLQRDNQYVFIRPRIRKIGRQRNFEQELKSLMEQNRIQLQQESKKNVKFNKYINKCMTQGTIEFNPELVKKSSKVIKISSFLRTIKNLQALTKSRRRERQKKNQSYNQKGSKYWSSVVKNMKNAQFLSKRQRIQALYSVNSGQISNNSQVTPIQPQDKFIPRNQNPRPEGVNHKIQRSMNHKRTKLQFNNILPDIKQFKEFITPLNQEITFSPSPIKSIHFNSRRLKKQLQDFLNQQNIKKY